MILLFLYSFINKKPGYVLYYLAKSACFLLCPMLMSLLTYLVASHVQVARR